MTGTSQTPRGLNRRPRILAFALLVALGGCTANGDFGEVRPELVRDDIHDWVGRDAIAVPPAAQSHFDLTDDERQLRDLSYPLIEPPYERQKPYSVLGEYGFTGADRGGPFDRTRYAAILLSDRYRSPAARYEQLNDDIRNDIERLPQFVETAVRVIDIDRKRRLSLGYVSSLSAQERADAHRRIRENALIVSLVQGKLMQRISAYRFALERLVIATPSPQAVEVERALNRLQAMVTQYRGGPPWRRPDIAAR